MISFQYISFRLRKAIWTIFIPLWNHLMLFQKKDHTYFESSEFHFVLLILDYS